MRTYNAVASREGKYWVVTVEGVGVTQARRLAEVKHMAADLVSVMTDRPVEESDVHVVPRLRPGLSTRVAAARAAAAEADAAQRQAGALNRAVARDLLDEGLSSTDTAEVLGLSRQRISQLVHR